MSQPNLLDLAISSPRPLAMSTINPTLRVRSSAVRALLYHYKAMTSVRLHSPSHRRVIHSLSQAPPKSCNAEVVDFVKVGLPEYKDRFAILIHDALSPDECQTILDAAEASNGNKWDQALVNIGNGAQDLRTDIRLCERIIWDDETITAKVMDRVLPHLPEDIINLRDRGRITGYGPVAREETWRISRLNERMRFLKYTRGMYFRPHCDGCYATPSNEEVTFLTVHLYLNGVDDSPETWREVESDDLKPLQGGATRFFGMYGKNYWDVNPRTGSILVFQHKGLLHSGDDVLQGTKYTMRSDILYRKVVD